MAPKGIAGSPGTRVLHTPDAGGTWQSFPTPTTVPLGAICFIDDDHGWAVGAMGTILATNDGGTPEDYSDDLTIRSGGTGAAGMGLHDHTTAPGWR